MGAVIIPATLVLGIVALIHPIQTDGLELLTESRMVLAAAAVLFFIFAATHRRINRFEAIILLVLYASFVSWAIFAS
jgi:Ca2+/Na+ antiporter